MSNLSIFRGGSVPAEMRAQIADETAQAFGANLPSGSWAKVSRRNSQFHLVSETGEEFHVPERYLDMVIIKANPAVSHSYYEGAWVAGDNRAPDCYSDDGIRPAARVANPRSPACASCPLNAFGSKINPTTGAQGKACTDRKRLAVMVYRNGTLDTTVRQFDIPPASLKAAGSYANMVSSYKTKLIEVVTRVAFSPNAVGLLTFEAAAHVPESDKEHLYAGALSETALLATGMKAPPVFEDDGEIETHEAPAGIFGKTANPPPLGSIVPAPAAPAAEAPKRGRGRPPKDAAPAPAAPAPAAAPAAQFPLGGAEAPFAQVRPVSQTVAGIVAQPEEAGSDIDSLLDDLDL